MIPAITIMTIAKDAATLIAIMMITIRKDVMTHMMIITRTKAAIEKGTNMTTIIEVSVTGGGIMAERTAIEITEGIEPRVS